MNIVAEHQEPTEVLSQLGDMSTPQFSGSESVASVAASGVLVAASGVICDSSLFSLEIAAQNYWYLTARMKTSVSLINKVALVGPQYKALVLQGRVVDVAHVDQGRSCYSSLTAE